MKNLLVLFLALISYNSQAQCNASFNASYIDCDSIWFVPGSVGPQYVYFWDFGNGNTSQNSHPTNTYTTNGPFTVILTLQDTVANCFQSQTQVVNINCAASCTTSAIFTYNQNATNCETQFVSTATGGTPPYSFFWNFGDGQSSTQQNPTHQYPNNAVYTPCVTITDATGCDTTICSTLSSSCSPAGCDAQFTLSYVTCDSLFFYPVSTGSQYTYQWDFGDGTYSTSPIPTHEYATDGSYQVLLVVTDNIAGCSQTVMVPVFINCGVNCTTDGAISWNQNLNSCAINFVSTAFGGTAPYSYFWNFGDGGSSNLANPSHIYPANGSYTPCLTITDANGCDTTICTVIGNNCITTSCDAFFNPAQTSCNTVVLYPSSQGPQYNYYWDFGDGTTGSGSNPTHSYSTDGVYIISLTLTDSLSGCSDTQIYTIVVNCGTCTVDGDFVYTQNASNCNVIFSATAFGGQAPYSFYWNFGDGQTSTQQSPTHQYPNNSVYTPCLTITDVNGCDTTICYSLQSTCTPAACDAQFTYTFATCDSLFFYPVSTGPQYTYNWDFGDGTYSSLPNPSHQFAGNGTYLVVLYIMDQVTTCQTALTIPVTINCAASPCNVNGAFSWNQNLNSCAINFVSTAFGGTAPYSYFWNFGDGQSSNAAHPSHIYPANGAYVACLTITDANGCDTTICSSVGSNCITTSCDAFFNPAQISCNTVALYPTSQGPQYNYYWDFGDGTTGSGSNPTHTYSTDGVYIISLTLTDSLSGCSDTQIYTIVVNCGTCTVDGDFVYTQNASNCNVIFSATAFGGQAPYNYYWNFGDGQTSTQQSPTHQYPNNSVYTPCLTITDVNGCDTTICYSLFSNCTQSACDAQFTYAFIGCDSIQFIPVANGPQYTYQWSFGDGGTSTLASPTHTFANGVWTVQLVVLDSIAGCGDQTFVQIPINCAFTPCTTDGAFAWNVDSTTCNVNFISTAFGGTAPYTYYWNFGDGQTSTQANPIHSYPNNSVWTPCLTISDVNGCDTTICDVVQVNCTPTSCNAQFTMTYATCNSIIFYPVSVGPQYTYNWDFGDGTSSSSANPTHTYASNGVYVVVLYLIDPVSGCQDAFTYSINVNCANTCTVNGVITHSVDQNNCNVYFASSVWGGQAPYSYYWSFGDGTTSNQANPTHQYQNNSAWTPCLTVTDANGCDTTICMVVNVTCISNSCDASFNFTYTACDSILFIPLVNNVQYDYWWDFGDGSFSSDISPIHAFSNGQHVVVLYISDSLSGCTNAYTAVINVNCNASCDINGAISWYPDSSSCDVNFISTAFGGQAPYTYFWSFGDGTSSTIANPVLAYPPNSVWTPCLTITDVNGCDTIICTVVQSACTVGLTENVVKEDYLIYPNPTKGQFTIELTESSTIEMYDMSGKLIYSENCSGYCDQYLVDISDLESGTYLIRVHSETDIRTQRIIKN